tara:strand:- start:1168 stop:1359 length:192 start_codon:yes stop_codon:yes gene_type:complete
MRYQDVAPGPRGGREAFIPKPFSKLAALPASGNKSSKKSKELMNLGTLKEHQNTTNWLRENRP